MIEKRTVLVLGAGASMPYGLPSGDQLTKLVLKDSNSRTRLERIGHDGHKIDDFRRQLAASNVSVDFFLECRPQYARIGKTAIAAVLAPMERPAAFGSDPDDDWYKYLFNLMAPAESEGFGSNKLEVITFNYDRSFEHFFRTSLRALYGGTDEQVEEQMRALRIIHVHGTLGSLVQGDGEGWYKKYSENFSDEWLMAAHDHVAIVSERTSSSDPYVNARGKLKEAEQVVFLGCAYHEQNMTRLGFSNKKDFGKEVIGSSHGFTERERHGLRARWKVSVSPKDWKTLEYLREAVDLS